MVRLITREQAGLLVKNVEKECSVSWNFPDKLMSLTEGDPVGRGFQEQINGGYVA